MSLGFGGLFESRTVGQATDKSLPTLAPKAFQALRPGKGSTASPGEVTYLSALPIVS